MARQGKDTGSAIKHVWPLQLLLVLLVPAVCWPHTGDAVYPVSGSQAVGVANQAGSQDTGILEGKVRKGPLSPMMHPGLAGALVDIANVDGKPVASVKTDTAGNFRIRLPAGTYKVTMHSLYGALFTKDVPATVTIRANHEQRLDILLDTGIR